MNKEPIYLKLSDASNYVLGITGIYIPKSTLYAWCRTGKVSNDGCRIRLRSEKMYGTIYTKKKWVDTFLVRVG